MDKSFNGINRRHFLNGAGSLAALTLVGTTPQFSAKNKDWFKPQNRVLSKAKPEEVGMSSAQLEDINARLKERVDRGLIPGYSALVARHGKVVLQTAMEHIKLGRVCKA